MSRQYYYFLADNKKTTYQIPIALPVPKCTPEWQRKAEESYKRISAKYSHIKGAKAYV